MQLCTLVDRDQDHARKWHLAGRVGSLVNRIGSWSPEISTLEDDYMEKACDAVLMLSGLS